MELSIVSDEALFIVPLSSIVSLSRESEFDWHRPLAMFKDPVGFRGRETVTMGMVGESVVADRISSQLRHRAFNGFS